jgi:hypothetical protein
MILNKGNIAANNYLNRIIFVMQNCKGGISGDLAKYYIVISEQCFEILSLIKICAKEYA